MTLHSDDPEVMAFECQVFDDGHRAALRQLLKYATESATKQASRSQSSLKNHGVFLSRAVYDAKVRDALIAIQQIKVEYR